MMPPLKWACGSAMGLYLVPEKRREPGEMDQGADDREQIVVR